jgi:succinate-semialdehyde dehydrogenase / glutarate-semialdehyde dehydrogenase
MITAINPTTQKKLWDYAPISDAALEAAVSTSHLRFTSYRKSSFQERTGYLRALAKALNERIDKLSQTMTKEMGKPIAQARAEVEKCAWCCLYYAEQGPKMLNDLFVPTDGLKSYVSSEPLGIVLAIMPWNFPLWQVIRCAVPALLAGNTVLLKHAPNVPRCAVMLEDCFREAGFPEGCFQNVFATLEQTERLIRHRLVRGVSLTGSTQAGRHVAAVAGSSLKKCVLELGGSDPYIVLEDADLHRSAQVCAQARLQNNGQSCIAAKRFIVVRDVYKKWLPLFIEEMQRAISGDPLQPETTLGPLARKDLREQLHEQVQRSLELGAQVEIGGELPSGKGFFYPPTILTEVRKDSPAYGEELFGPVAAVIKAFDEKEAITIANDTNYGLGACLFTENRERGEQIAREELYAGSCFVNNMVKSDPRLPFGGIKNSGFGRELSHIGVAEFVNKKTVVIY